MSNNNVTRAQFDALTARVDAIAPLMEAIAASLGVEVPAVPAKVTKARATRTTKAPAKAEAPKSALTYTERKGSGKGLTKANRKDFIKAHAWAQDGMSTSDIRRAVAGGKRVNKGWSVKF